MRLVLLFMLLVTMLGAAERIVTLSPAVSEIVFGLGRGGEVVGVSRYAAWPEEVKELPKVGGFFNPSLERILALRPTLVIGHAKHIELLGQLEQLGVRVVRLELNRIDTIKQGIATLGTQLERPQRAAELIAAIDAAVAGAAQLERSEKVLVVFGLRREFTKRAYVAGHNLFFEEILGYCGAQNAYSDPYGGQPVLNIEGLISTNPDQVIIIHSLATDGDVDKEAILGEWLALPITAAKKRKVHILQQDYLNIPSHRVAQSIKTICEVLAR